jgi:hypothetical protein
MENIQEKFNELVKKADEERKQKIKTVKNVLLFFEFILQLSAFIIIYIKLGGWVSFAFVLLITGNNLQLFRHLKNK